MSEVNYIVKHETSYFGEQDYEWIGNNDELSSWMQYNSLKAGDEIYEVKLVGVIREKRELEIVKVKEDA